MQLSMFRVSPLVLVVFLKLSLDCPPPACCQEGFSNARRLPTSADSALSSPFTADSQPFLRDSAEAADKRLP